MRVYMCIYTHTRQAPERTLFHLGLSLAILREGGFMLFALNIALCVCVYKICKRTHSIV